MAPLQAERVLITGGSSGIGLATAIAYAGRGARVALVARGEDGLGKAARRVEAAGGEALPLSADVTDRKDIERAVAEASERFGGLDIGVSAAAASAYGRFTETRSEDFDATIATTLTGAVDTTRALLPELERSDGSLVLIGSIAARMPLPSLSAYSAAKQGLRGFAESLRAELSEQGSSVSVSLVISSALTGTRSVRWNG